MFRCDGGTQPEIGTGHVKRCLLMADRLARDTNYEIAFLMKEDAFENKRVLGKKYGLYIIDKKKSLIEQTLNAIADFSPAILVLDVLSSEEDYIRRIKESGVIVVALDDNGAGQKYADIGINAILETGHSLFGGPDYVVLPEINSRLKPFSEETKKMFICFGGYDHLNLTMKALKALESLSEDIEITAIINDSYKNQEELSNFVRRSKRKFNVYVNPPNFGELFSEADLAVISGGLTLFEAMARGVPSIVIGQYEHQVKTARRYEDAKAVICLGMGDQVSGSAILEKVITLAQDRNLRNSLRKRGMALVDGKGLQRVTDLIRIVSVLNWDTEFFEVKIAALHTLRINPDIVKYALDFCEKEQVKCLYYLSDCHDALSVKLAELNRFHFVDIRLTFENDLKECICQKGDKILKIRESTTDDICACQNIARKSYVDSRYYFDQHFSKEICEKFYSNWVARSIAERNDKVFVAEINGEIAGYLTCNLTPRGEQGRILLVGVDEVAKGAGVGTSLVNHALDWFRDQGVSSVEVVTQGRNVTAQRLYQKCGFRTLKTQLWYHKWFS